MQRPRASGRLAVALGRGNAKWNARDKRIASFGGTSTGGGAQASAVKHMTARDIAQLMCTSGNIFTRAHRDKLVYSVTRNRILHLYLYAFNHLFSVIMVSIYYVFMSHLSTYVRFIASSFICVLMYLVIYLLFICTYLCVS